MFRADQVDSASQIDLGTPLNHGQLQHDYPLRQPSPVLSTSSPVDQVGHTGRYSTASHASTSTARDAADDEEHRESSERSEAKGKKRDPGDAPDKVINKAALAAFAVPQGSTAAAATIQHDMGRSGRVGMAENPKDLGIEDKHRLFSPHIRKDRRKVYKLVFFIFTGITLWLWICLSIFWGSVYQLTSYLPNINVRFVTFDTDSAALLNGPITQQANYLASLPSSVPHLGWEVRSASDYPNGLDDVRREVLHQKSWVTVVVNANATSAWRDAVRNGDATYDPNGAIGIYYMGALFYQVQYLYTESLIKEELMNPISTARGNALQAFNTYAASNPGAIAAASNAPQALGIAFGYTIFDLRPIQNGAWSGAAPMEASLIYFVIFAFVITFVGAQARKKAGIEERWTFKTKVLVRLGWPLLAYFFISLWETLIIRAFQIPLGDYLGRAGFVVLWALNFVTIIAAGLAMETVLCIVGIPFLPVFLILWIILNITSSFYPLTLMPRFYQFLRWTPFLHNIEAFKIIAYGTNAVQRLGYHFGIIFGLIGVELICFPLAMFYERWSTDKQTRREVWDKRELKEQREGA